MINEEISAVAVSRPFSLVVRFIHLECPAAQLRAVQSRYGVVGGFRILHFDESETFRAVRVTVGNDPTARNSTVLVKQILEFIFFGSVVEIPYIDFFLAYMLLLPVSDRHSIE